MTRLLFVDDDPNAFEIWGGQLKADYQWHVVHALGPTEAKEQLQRAEQAGRPFDVIIIDRRMPDPNTGEMREDVGDELLSDVTARWRYVCPIMLTNFGGEEPAQRATRHGAYRYLMKGTEAKTIDRVCRKGIQMQLIKRLRHTLLYLGSLDQLVHELQSKIGDILTPHAYGFAYLKHAPGGTLLVGDYITRGCPAGPLATALESGCAFVSTFPCIEEVRASRRYLLKTRRSEINSSEGSLLKSPGSQLIVPILEPEDPPKPGSERVVALFWIESTEEEGFDHEDAEAFSALADYVGIAMPGVREVEERRLVDCATERDGLLSEVAHRICNPLQIAQSDVDLISARLGRGERLGPEELRSQLEQALASIEQAIQAAEQLRQTASPRRVTLRPVALGPLVQEVTNSFGPHAQVNSCVIQVEMPSAIPKVKLDQAEMRYVLNCILGNTMEAIQRKRTNSGGEPEMGRVRISVCADPLGTRGVSLLVQDNGCGICPEDLPRIFERYFSSKEQDFRQGKHGLGLWQAKRFIEAAGGVIQVKSRLGEGAEIQVFLPACDDDAPSVEVTV